MDFLKPHYDTEGPFGLPMKDAQAQALEAIMKRCKESPDPCPTCCERRQSVLDVVR
jgi:hypothetical protein